MARHFSTKTYGNDRGLSCAFRQWKATHSHCSLIHGYSLGFRLVFEAEALDQHNWVQDFGGLDEIKQYLEDQFDHKLAVAADDPELEKLQALGDSVAKVNVLAAVGCEAFAQQVYEFVEIWLEAQPDNKYENLMGDEYPRVRIKSVECFEHAGNSAIYGD